MSDEFATDKPIRPSPELIEALKNWQYPKMDKVAKDPSKTNAMGKNEQWLESRRVEEVIEEVEEPKLPTLEEVEEIRKQAYDDGFAEGKIEGSAKGFEEGTAQGLEEGLAQGLEKGTEEGLASGKEQADQINANIENVLSQLYQPLRELDDDVEKQLLGLVTQLASAVIDIELSINDQVILKALRESIKALPVTEKEIEIQLNPLDADVILSNYSEEDIEERNWKILKEPSIVQGGLLVQSQSSSIDYSIKERVKNTLERFLHDADL